MSKEQKITNDIKVPNKDLEALRLNFPHCFDKDGNFQLEKFKANLTEKEINFSTESYGLDWLGKSYARLLASDPATTLLKADETHNSKPENANSENLLIKGDNLEVLKHLANAYYEQVKMIYIDPPYNTGSDGFVYEDDRKFTVKELQNLIGIDAEKAKRILDFTKQRSNSHSAWLTFMYPRLYIAKQLLKDEGVIFVSIDDNEVAQIRALLDEIFGEENFVAQIIIDGTPKNDPYIVSTSHEYAVVYTKIREKAKNANYGNNDPIYAELISIFEKNNSNYEATMQELDSFYKERNLKKDNIANYKYADEDGIYRIGPIDDPQNSGPKDERINPKTGNPCKVPNRGWSCTIDTWNEWKDDNLIDFPDNDDVCPSKKTYIHKDRTDVMRSYFKIQTRKDSTYLKTLFKTPYPPFANPKPVELLKQFILNTNDKEGIYLDFFAGSGSLGDSIIQCNISDNGSRKFILVQLPELIEIKGNGKAKKIANSAIDFLKEKGVEKPTIFDITKYRLILSSEIHKQKNPIFTEQIGFKIFETTPIWEDYNFEAEQFDSSQTLFDAGKLTEDDIKALLTTWKTYDGTALTQALESVDLSGYTAYYGNGRLYLMNKGFTTDSLKTLLEKIDTDKHFEPKSIIAFGYHLESKSLREISENVKTYNNKKKSDIDFITRY